MASAQKCGSCQQKTTPKKTSAGQSSEPVTAAQPISTGAAPGSPPNTVLCRVRRLSTIVYTTEYASTAAAVTTVAKGVVKLPSSTSETHASTTPNSSADRGAITPLGIGRSRVRDMIRSMSRSYQQLIVFAAPAANIPPTMVARNSPVPGQPPAASIIAGSVVTSSSSTSLGLVSET